MKVRRGLTGCAVLVVVGLLAACEDSPEAGTVDPTVTEATDGGSAESTEPETTEPTTAEEATEPVPELSEVPGEEPEITFVKHFYDVYNYARSTGDVGPLVALTTEDCRNCQNIVEWISEIYAGGGTIEGGEYELLEEPQLKDQLDPVEVWLSFKESAITITESADASPEQQPACELLNERVELHKGDDGWLVGEITVTSPCV